MRIIPLDNVPNQVFTVNIEGNVYRIQARTIQDFTLLSVWQNDDLLFYNQVCVPNSFVNPYKYVSEDGRLFFRCLDNEYPNYRQFGNTQTLYFLTPEEAENL